MLLYLCIFSPNVIQGARAGLGPSKTFSTSSLFPPLKDSVFQVYFMMNDNVKHFFLYWYLVHIPLNYPFICIVCNYLRLQVVVWKYWFWFFLWKKQTGISPLSLLLGKSGYWIYAWARENTSIILVLYYLVGIIIIPLFVCIGSLVIFPGMFSNQVESCFSNVSWLLVGCLVLF